MCDVVVPATFEDISKSDHVAVDICSWILQRVSYASLRSKVCHPVERLFLKQGANCVRVSEIHLHEGKATHWLQPLQARHLQSGIIIRVKVVDSHDLDATLEQAGAEVEADE